MLQGHSARICTNQSKARCASFTSRSCCDSLCQPLTAAGWATYTCISCASPDLHGVLLHKLEAVMVASQRYANRAISLPPQATSDSWFSAHSNLFVPLQGLRSGMQSHTTNSGAPTQQWGHTVVCRFCCRDLSLSGITNRQK